MQRRNLGWLVAVASILVMAWALGCGGGGGNSGTPPPPPPSGITITIFPDSTTVQAGRTQQFTATVMGSSNTAVNWSATVGTINASGLYTAPSSVPTPPTGTVTATSQADTSKSAGSSVTIVAPGTGDINQRAQSFPIKLGTSGGNDLDKTTTGRTVTCCSGTLGALLDRGGTKFILSNNHVVARRDQGAAGEAISQPGLVDANCSSATTVGHLTQAPPLRTSNVDAAIAEIVPGAVDLSGAILELTNVTEPAPPASTIATATPNMPVAKSGRSTGLTCSSVQAVNTNVQVDYTPQCNSGTKFTITFRNQIVVAGGGFSSAGDSGSLIVNSQTAQPVALLYGGTSTDTVGNPIADVLAAFSDSNGNVPTIVGGGQHSVACPASAQAATAQAAAVSESRMAQATIAKNKHANELMMDPAVIGVGVGASDDSRGDAAIVIFVERGKPRAPIPAEIDGVRTKVIFTDRFRARTGVQPEAGTRVVETLADSEVARATAVKQKHVAALMSDASVMAVGVGASEDKPGQAAVVIYLEEGKSSAPVPAQIDGVPTKIIKTDRFRAIGWNEKPQKTCRLK